jgi:hypothetical protein
MAYVPAIPMQHRPTIISSQSREVTKMNKTIALLNALADGLTGYMTYESRCGMSMAYTEYLLYGPIVRIANHLGWRVETEWPHEKTVGKKATRGDYRRIDFVFRPAARTLKGWVALEVKWLPTRKTSLDVSRDVSKLRKARKAFQSKDLQAFLIVAGVHGVSGCDSPKLKVEIKGLRPTETPCVAKAFNAGTRARYGATIYEIK